MNNDNGKPFDPRRQFLRRALDAGLWAMVGSSGLMAPLVHALGTVKGQLADGKSIHDWRGEVKVDGAKVDDNSFISANSLVETGSGSFVIFAIGKDAHMLRENSRVQFTGGKKTVAIRSREDTLEDGLTLATGKMLSVFGKRSAGESHTLKTTTATIGIRGTGVYAESEADNSYVCTCYGVVDIASSTDATSKEQIISKHHDAPRYILADGKAGSLIVPAPMKNHTDEELMLIEALVGRAAPLSNVKGYSSPRKGY